MTLDLADRRALLREALRSDDPADLSSFLAAIDGAGEADRIALAKTLPPSRLFTSEGPTLRAYFVLVALGKPQLVADTLFPDAHHRADEVRGPLTAAAEVIFAAAAVRDDAWRYAFIDLMQGWVLRELQWNLVRRLVAEGGLTPSSTEYVRMILGMATHDDASQRGYRGAERIVEVLRSDPLLLRQDFWEFFRVEGTGSAWLLTQAYAEQWDRALHILADTEPGFRDRLLDESLESLLRDFSSRHTVWYQHVHRLLDPTPDEVVARAGTYLAVMGTASSTAVGLAQEMLKRAIDRIDGSALVEASAAVISRTEKKLVKAQLLTLRDLVAREPALAAAVGQVVAQAMDGLPADLAAVARRLAPTAPVDLPIAGDPVVVPAPRRRPTSAAAHGSKPIADDEELRVLVAEYLEGVGDGTDMPRILGYLAEHPASMIGPASTARAEEVRSSVWDLTSASPRRLLADLLIARETGAERQVEFRGYVRHLSLRPGDPAPEGAVVTEHTATRSTFGSDGKEHVQETYTFRSAYRFLPSHGPLALFAGQFDGPPATTPLRREDPTWTRVLAAPGAGAYERDLTVLGDGPKPFWIGSEGVASAGFDPVAVLDVSEVAREFGYRMQEAREQDGYDQIVQWAGWLLQENPGVLAAHFHPMLWTATQVVNVRGVGALFAALGASRHIPDGPVYSALALGLSAKEAPQRAQAAEAVAELASAGLLDAEPFAAEIGTHLVEGFVMAGRVSQGLADAASISAISGYRVLQTLAAMLPAAATATQGGKLVELAARLSDEYGTAITVPDELAAKRRGSSALATAVRSLEAVVPRPTPLAAEAAQQADSALDQETRA